METERQIARALIKIGAIKFNPNDPITFKSGILSPVYVDNRKLPYYPEEWKIILSGFKNLIEKENIDFDIIAGVESGGIPHSAALGFILEKPSIFIRKQVKDHGTKSRIEGGEVKDKKVLLIEDLVSMGTSSLNGVQALRDEGAITSNCIVIVSYDFFEAKKAFTENHVRLLPLTSFSIILEEAIISKTLSEDDASEIRAWFTDPASWTQKYNLK